MRDMSHFHAIAERNSVDDDVLDVATALSRLVRARIFGNVSRAGF
jgi:hypothetical protein